MEIEVIAAVRDSRALTKNEKLFLFTVASHRDGMYCTHQKNYSDMGISKATYYRLRESLTETGVLLAQRRMDDTTVYRVSLEALLCLPETRLSHDETKKSQSETPESHCAETKDNTKDNKQDNLSREQTELPEDFSARELLPESESSSGVIPMEPAGLVADAPRPSRSLASCTEEVGQSNISSDSLASKEAPAGRLPAPALCTEEKARQALAWYMKPGTYTELSTEEQTRAVTRIRDPRWNRMIKDIVQRAGIALKEQVTLRPKDW